MTDRRRGRGGTLSGRGPSPPASYLRPLHFSSRPLPMGPALGGKFKSNLGAATCLNKSLSNLPQFLHFYLSKNSGN